MNGFFHKLIQRIDIDQSLPIEQTDEFKTVCNYYTLLQPHDKLEFVEKLNGITLNDVLEELYYYNYPLFLRIEQRGKPEIERLNAIFREAKTLLLCFVKEVTVCAKIQ